MPPEEKNDVVVPTPDMFGESKPVETPVVETPAVKKEEGKAETKPVDIKEDPYVKGLEKKLEDYGTNLSGQGKLIKELQTKLGLKSETPAEKGANPESPVLFKEVLTSKDLTEAQRDEMTDTEIKQFDEIAELKKNMNTLATLISTAKGEKGADKGDGAIDMEVVDDLSTETKAMALKLAGDDIEMANKIINEFNQFAGNDSLNRTQLAERLAKSAKLVPEYKAPKEQIKVRGSTVGGIPNAKGNDEFGTDAIIEQAQKGSSGTYSL